jgi:hypothetical protein
MAVEQFFCQRSKRPVLMMAGAKSFLPVVVAGAGLTVDTFGASLAYPGKKAFLAFVETQVRRERVWSPLCRPVRRARGGEYRLIVCGCTHLGDPGTLSGSDGHIRYGPLGVDATPGQKVPPLRTATRPTFDDRNSWESVVNMPSTCPERISAPTDYSVDCVAAARCRVRTSGGRDGYTAERVPRAMCTPSDLSTHRTALGPERHVAGAAYTL